MKLIETIPLSLVKADIQLLGFRHPNFTFVISQGYLKIYKQVKKL
jgi:hypothetical protein